LGNKGIVNELKLVLIIQILPEPIKGMAALLKSYEILSEEIDRTRQVSRKDM